MVLRVNRYIINVIQELSKINHLDRMRTFNSINIRKGSKRITNLHFNAKFFVQLSRKPSSKIFTKINMSARQFIHSWKKFFSIGSPRKEDDVDPIHFAMD